MLNFLRIRLQPDLVSRVHVRVPDVITPVSYGSISQRGILALKCSRPLAFLLKVECRVRSFSVDDVVRSESEYKKTGAAIGNG